MRKQENVYHTCYKINVIILACLSQMKNQVRAYFHEAKWFHKKHIPIRSDKDEASQATQTLKADTQEFHQTSKS
jgi:hypothetical protein